MVFIGSLYAFAGNRHPILALREIQIEEAVRIYMTWE